MKVSVLGAGAIGSMVGGLIKQHAPDVEMLLVMRGEHGRVVQQRGKIQLDGPWGRHDVSVDVSFDVADIAGSDFVLLTVKSQATEEAISGAAPQLGDATVISIQNGINDETLLKHVRLERLVMGMTATNIAILEPGTVSLQLDGATVVGPAPDGSNQEATRQAARLLDKPGLQIEQHENILGIRYNKLAQNAIGYASCMSASNFITEAVCYRPWRTHVGAPIIDECIRAYQLAGIELAKIPGRPDVRKIRRFLTSLDKPVIGSIVGFGAKMIYNRKPIIYSLYLDLKHGKKTEVDFINGQVVRLAEMHGGAAPRNALVVRMVRELEARGDGSFYSREEVVDRFRELESTLSPPA